MLIQFFRNHKAIHIFILILISLVLSVGGFFHSSTVSTFYLEPALGKLLFKGQSFTLSVETNVVLTALITAGQGLFLNRLVTSMNLFSRPNFLTALLYIVISSSLLPFLFLSPALICNFITIWMLGRLISMYQLAQVKQLMFDLGILTAIGSLIYFPFLSMILLLWIALFIFRPFDWREWVTPLIGCLSIYFLIFVAYVWYDRTDDFFLIFSQISKPKINDFSIDIQDYWVLFPILLGIVLFIVTLKEQFFKSVVQIRKSFLLLFYMLLLFLISSIFTSRLNISHVILCTPVIAIYLSYYFTHAKNPWVYETLLSIMIAAGLFFTIS